ncbi:MAG: excinuclease ABC subunit UvrA [bacterium]|nr:excinuclease ABC subunit UvrA [bacterium]
MDQYISIKGAGEHNLKNINVDIPKNKLVIFTGVSGSGKSSLAMDTIYAEGQRRYVESLSSYARQFLGVMKKPEIESIDGLSPAIAIDQKTVSHNPRSTVGTVTEIYDYLRLLFARIGHPHCPNCHREISHMTIDQMVNAIMENKKNGKKNKRILILSPIIKDRKGEYSQLFSNLMKQGFSKVRVDGKIYPLDTEINLIKTNKHNIDVLVDRIILSDDSRSRLSQSIESGLSLANGYVIISEVLDASFEFPEFPEKMEDHLYSERFACPVCNIAMPEIAPRSFSFNSPHGACEDCTGLGTKLKIEERSILAPEISVLEGGIIPWASLMDKQTWNRSIVESVSRKYGIDLNRPVQKLPKENLNILLYGTKNEKFSVKHKGQTYEAKFEGVVPNLERRYHETNSEYIRSEIQKYMIKEDCPTCIGTRLNKSALGVTIMGKNIAEVSELSTKEALVWIKEIAKTISAKEAEIGKAIILEITARLEFLIDVGLTYLTISRTSATLAGGEAQRIRLASQVGSKLSGILYVLDEPSIGLHPRDHARLIKTLKNLRDLGNSVLVVEHDEQTMLESDYIIDFGPGAGLFGGTITAMGTPSEIMQNKNSLTGAYLSGRKKVDIKKHLSKEDLKGFDTTRSPKNSIKVLNCSGNNLKNIDVEIPLNRFVCITGVSGSGKSTLVNDTINKMLRQELDLKNDEAPAKNDGIIGANQIDKVINIDQNPIGRTPRSNPATYTKVFDDIRALFSQSEAAKIRGYQPGRFSFNVKGGRCEACQGDGQIKIEMQFMPDVYIDCEICAGKRYNRETLEVEFRGKNVSEILDMTVESALEFFANHPKIVQRLSTLHDVGLGYLKLGQPAPTLSGGEAQRIKLASELSKRPTGKTFYILDEPTTGLHFADLERLIAIIKRLVIRGNTVLVIEHNLDVIRYADWIIDLGPEGGKYGGEIMFKGTVLDLMKDTKSYTAEALRQAKRD